MKCASCQKKINQLLIHSKPSVSLLIYAEVCKVVRVPHQSIVNEAMAMDTQMYQRYSLFMQAA